jgi:hypothetical protein
VTTLRPSSSVVIGAVGALAGLALLTPALLASPRDWAIVASLVLGLVLLWLFVVRPCARIHADGIQLVNPLRVVDLTWPAIQEVRSKWALELVASGRRYTAWGVPADVGRPRHGRGALTLGTNKAASGAFPVGEKRPKVEARAVAAEIEARIAADRHGGNGGHGRDGRPRKIAKQSWDVLAVGLLIGATAFFVIAVFVA